MGVGLNPFNRRVLSFVGAWTLNLEFYISTVEKNKRQVDLNNRMKRMWISQGQSQWKRMGGYGSKGDVKTLEAQVPCELPS